VKSTTCSIHCIRTGDRSRIRFRFVAAAVVTALVLSIASCDDDSPVGGTPTPTVHTIRDVDYVKDTYFMIDHEPGVRGAVESSFELFRRVTPQDILLDPSLIRFPGWAIVDPLNDGQALADAVAQIAAGQTPAGSEIDEFALLEPGVDYAFLRDDTVVVGFELFEPLPEVALKSLAVRYRTPSGDVIGGSYSTYGISAYIDTLVLEMIKPRTPDPSGPFGSTWSLAVRTVYDLGLRNIAPGTYDLEIDDVLAPRPDPSAPEGASVPYTRIFGLDVTGESGSGPPDGHLDSGRIDLTRGLLYFPDAHGFAPDASNVQAWTGGAFAFTGAYQAQYDRALRIYQEKLNPSQADDVHQYVIRFTRR